MQYGVKNSRWKFSAGIAVAVLALSAQPGAAAQVEPAAGWAAVAGCANQVTERARHTCMDQVLRDAGLLAAAPAAPGAAAPAPMPQTPPMPPAAAHVPPPAPIPPAPVAAPAPAAIPDRQEFKIAAIRSAADGRLIFTAPDGTVWRQTERMAMARPPFAGETVAIRKGAMGSFICAVGSNPTFRCTYDR